LSVALQLWPTTAYAQQFGLAPEDIDNVYFVPGVFKFTEISERIKQEMAAQELALVIVDTSAAYFETDDENNNMQALAHAKRLRELSRLPGGPTVLICCHPTKAAESLVPRGGGAFLNEVDGNLTCKRDDLAVELHWHGKRTRCCYRLPRARGCRPENPKPRETRAKWAQVRAA
jgi:hypothetical protein